MPTPCARDGKGPGHQYGLPDLVEPTGTRRGLLPTPRATDGAKGCPGQRGSRGDLTLPSAAVRIPLRNLPTPTASDRRGPGRRDTGGPGPRWTVAALPEPAEPDEARWGVYAAAVARWEALLGRPAPDPTQPGRYGKPVLAPPFVEWLMGLPPEWVTDPGLGLPRTLALRVLGNGVVPQQAAAAIRLLLCPRWWITPYRAMTGDRDRDHNHSNSCAGRRCGQPASTRPSVNGEPTTMSTNPATNPRPSATPSDGGGVWTPQRVRALGAVTDLPTAARIFGLGRALAYELARNGEFPVPVIRVGSRYRVPVAPILTALHLPDSGDLTTLAQPSVDHDREIRSVDAQHDGVDPSRGEPWTPRAPSTNGATARTTTAGSWAPGA